jgi:hypothetical protein
MIEKTVTIKNLNDSGQAESDLEYWLSKTPDERISAVEILRRQYYGNSERLQRTVRIIQQS